MEVLYGVVINGNQCSYTHAFSRMDWCSPGSIVQVEVQLSFSLSESIQPPLHLLVCLGSGCRGIKYAEYTWKEPPSFRA